MTSTLIFFAVNLLTLFQGPSLRKAIVGSLFLGDIRQRRVIITRNLLANAYRLS